MTAGWPSVLLVEDDESTRRMFEALFEQWAYRLTTAATATEGLRRVMGEDFDAIVIDNWLPDLDGIELCRQMREFHPFTPIVFYSAAAPGIEDRRAFQAGADAYVYKGEGAGRLRVALADALARSRKPPRKPRPWGEGA